MADLDCFCRSTDRLRDSAADGFDSGGTAAEAAYPENADQGGVGMKKRTRVGSIGLLLVLIIGGRPAAQLPGEIPDQQPSGRYRYWN